MIICIVFRDISPLSFVADKSEHQCHILVGILVICIKSLENVYNLSLNNTILKKLPKEVIRNVFFPKIKAQVYFPQHYFKHKKETPLSKLIVKLQSNLIE